MELVPGMVGAVGGRAGPMMEGLESVVVWVHSGGRKWEGPEVSGVAVAPEESLNSFIQRFFGCLPCEVRFWELRRHRSVGWTLKRSW